MSDELQNLRTEVERLLASALADAERHYADVERRDLLHLHELERRDELHLAETAARDRVHLQELAARDEIHADELEHLRRALETRDLLGQAKGVIMATMGCSADDAFDLIVKQSQHENRRATEVATEVVRTAGARTRLGGSARDA